MSSWMKYVLIFVATLAASLLGSWLMDPANTPLHGWLAPSLGEEGVRLLRYAVVGLAAGLATVVLETIDRSRRAARGV